MADEHYDDWDDDHWHYDDDDDDDWAVPLALVGGVLLGATIASLPDNSQTVYSGGQPYYYSGGNYYQPAPSGGYQAVAAPTGAEVQELPPQTVNVNVEGDKNYYYSNGAYYEEQAAPAGEENPEYKIVPPPMGAMVPDLPDGTAKKTVNDQTYFVYGETWYKPFYSGDEVAYKVIEEPTAAAPAAAPPSDAPPSDAPPSGAPAAEPAPPPAG